MYKKVILLLIIMFCSCFYMGFSSNNIIKKVYQVYLDGENLGMIESKEELEKHIDKMQNKLKKKYGVKNVYAPKGLDIKSFKTFSPKISNINDIYKKIEDKKPFTIDGYDIIIKDTENEEEEEKHFYVIDKSVFLDAVERIITTFVDKDQYELYLNNEQLEIKETGSLIENVDINEDITIKKDRISVDNEIMMNVDDMTKMLLFGTTEKQDTYTVQTGDTIEQVAFNNKLSAEEFLIANPEFTSKDNLLYQGQQVNIGLIDPQFSVVLETHVVEDKVKNYEQEIKYDASLLVGNDYVERSGEDGLERITQKVRSVNGEIQTVVTVSSEELKPVINEIYVKGGKVIPSVGDTSSWAWPTIQGYTISSQYGYRWGRLHRGVDISGTGHGSPIYVTNNGTVYKTGYNSSMGYYIYVNHNNGYFTAYEHLSKILVSEGQVVARKQQIGEMGNTGVSTGTHLHYEIWTGGAPYQGGTSHNPLLYY